LPGEAWQPRLEPEEERRGAARMFGRDRGFEVSEVEAIRHFTRLSTWNYAIDMGLYPLGSCTMKYNPRVNEWRLLWAFGHTLSLNPSQGAWSHGAEKALAEITGMDAVTLQPAAGAHGERRGSLIPPSWSGRPRRS
jgi:glycine dehydrogenase subunit 2